MPDLSQGPSPSAAKVGEPPKQRAPEDKKDPSPASERREPGPSVSVSVAPVISASATQQPSGHQSGAAGEGGLKVISDLLLVAFTGVLAWATIRLMKVTGDNARAAADSAKAAKELIEATLSVESPYLIPEIIRRPTAVIEPPPKAVYSFANEGHSPGIILKFQDVLRFLVAPLPANPDDLFGDQWANRPQHYFPVGPGRAVRESVQAFRCGLSPADQGNLGNPGRVFYLLGRVEYADLFGRRREQRFCWSIDGTLIVRTGGPAYNYDRPIG